MRSRSFLMLVLALCICGVSACGKKQQAAQKSSVAEALAKQMQPSSGHGTTH